MRKRLNATCQTQCTCCQATSAGRQIGHSLYERRVGCKVITRDADALDPLREFLNIAFPDRNLQGASRTRNTESALHTSPHHRAGDK
jgi:hypothetical protein